MRLAASLLLALAATCHPTAANPTPPRPPNIVILLADDLGYADLGAQGATDVRTPHLDRLAAEGVRCTDGYANHPVCAPSRAALLSGMYPHRFGFEHNPGPEGAADPAFGLPPAIPTLAEKLRTAGYATGMVGKWHVGYREGTRPHERGFDESYVFLSGARSYRPPGEGLRRTSDPLVVNGTPLPAPEEPAYLTTAFGREAAAFIDRHAGGDRPFFLYLAFNAVHTPMEATPDLEARFPSIADPRRRTYAGMLAALDDAVGLVLDRLQAHGVDEHTLVFFYSDNGGPTPQTTSRNDPLRGTKGQVLEGGIRVPFLVRWPGTLPAATVYRHPVAGFDVHATALAAAARDRAPPPAAGPSLDGVDLLPFLTGARTDAPHEALFWRSGPQHAARRGDWKLVVERDGTPHLYDLAADIGETTDLAAREPARLAELQAAYAAWEARTEPARWQRQVTRPPPPDPTPPEAPTTPNAPPSTTAAPPPAPAPAPPLFTRLDRDGDGRITEEEAPRADVFRLADADRDGAVTPEELSRWVASTDPRTRPPAREAPPSPVLPPDAPGEPPRQPGRDSDAVRDAAGRGQLFESIHVPGLTDLREGCNGIALADLNHDGHPDLVGTFSTPRGHPPPGGQGPGESLRVWLGRGGFRFEPHSLTLRDSPVTMDDFGRGQVPALADFNRDGHLDLLVTRHVPATAGRPAPRGGSAVGNSLFVTDGAWDVLRDVSEQAGLRNEDAYNRQPALGDVDRDGWIDVAIGCDNIGNAMGGVPRSRLYVFQPGPGPDPFATGRFRDLGDSDLVPDFGGFHHDSARDRAGPDINLHDLDGDGDLDLLQACHVDVREPLLPYSPGEYRQGVFAWRNLLAETGALRFEKAAGNGLAVEARLRYDRATQRYEPEGRAPGLPYVSFADLDGDGLPEVLAVGPCNPGWAPRTEEVSGRLWRNLGGFRFAEATETAGLGPLNWTDRERMAFFAWEPAPRLLRWSAETAPPNTAQPGRPRPHPLDGRPYFADAVFADFDNDGWLDLVVQDRSEGYDEAARATYFAGRPGGTFEIQPTSFSGLDANGICAEPADLDGDGLLDLVFPADPDNSGVARDLSRYETRVYWNTGAHGARANGWLHLTFSGVTHAELIGARVGLVAGGHRQTRWVAPAHSYKSGGALDAHFGLGQAPSADVIVTLPDGRTVTFEALPANRALDLNLRTRAATAARPASAPVVRGDGTPPPSGGDASRSALVPRDPPRPGFLDPDGPRHGFDRPVPRMCPPRISPSPALQMAASPAQPPCEVPWLPPTRIFS